MNRITALFGIKYPIIQGGMVWCSGWRLASAVSNNGGLGLLGAGSMHPAYFAVPYPEDANCNKQSLGSECTAFVSRN